MKTKGKVIIALSVVVVIVLSVVIGLYSLKNGSSVTVSYPNGYTVITGDNVNSNADFIKSLGYGTSSFENYLKQKDIRSFAASADNSRQFRLIVKSTELSSQLRDITDASNDELEYIAKSLLPNGYEYIVHVNDLTFFQVYTKVKDDGGNYCTLQYVTIKNGNYYSLNYYGSTYEITDDERKVAEDVLETVRIPNSGGIKNVLKSSNTMRIFYIVFFGVVIVIWLVLTVLLSISIIRDLSRRKNASVDENFKIKRRRR